MPAKRKLPEGNGGNMDISAMFKNRVVAKEHGTEHHCAMPGCTEEVFAACSRCSSLLCFDHFDGSLSSDHDQTCIGKSRLIPSQQILNNPASHTSLESCSAQEPCTCTPSSHTSSSKSVPHSDRKSKVKQRKYDSDYIRFGFIAKGNQPLCLICLQVLSNVSMKPAYLKRHLSTLHPELVNKPREYFERQRDIYRGQKTKLKSCVTVNEKVLLASYLVAQRVARAKKPHTIAEDMILPAALDMCATLLGKEYSNKLKLIPLSNDTIGRRICDMSQDIKEQLVNRLQQCIFAIQLDESTDIASDAQLLLYVRYIWEGQALEDLLFCKTLSGNTTGEAIFNVVDQFFQQNTIPWKNCVGMCTDGAAAMTGIKSGVVARMRLVAPQIRHTHCMIHCEALAAKKINENLAEVFEICVKVVNFIKARPLNNRLFAVLCNEMGAGHEHLLLHNNVRWLSRGRVVERVYELRQELILFLSDVNFDLATSFMDVSFIGKLAYLADIFNLLNSLNASLQGPDMHILKAHDKITAFRKKLRIWKVRCEAGVFDMFPLYSEHMQETTQTSTVVNSIIVEHLTHLAGYFNEYFDGDDLSESDWIRNPFDCELTDLTGRDQEELAELSSDGSLRLQFSQKDLTSFWAGCAQEYPLLSNKALTLLLSFSTTYLCEASFSALTAIKSKYRCSLQTVEDDLRVCLVQNIQPRFESLCAAKQAHPSH